ncbi:MAG: xanthine dehydrogenase molybdopterin binding subunit [Flavobacteriales bacterium]|nr:MAG: xanthine dehydrogenase molybdopterin binding subunit [Flavobacteriales bacterium]
MKEVAHESGAYHTTGEAVYIDDMLVNEQLLHGQVVYSPHAHAKIKSFDLSEAQKLPGVHAVLRYKDIPGENQMGPVIHDELVLVKDTVTFIGQAIFLIAADNEEIAIEAEKLIKIEYEPLEPVLSIEDAIDHGKLIQPQRKIETGNVENGLNNSSNIIEGELKIGGQEQWYLETQVCLALPGEGSELKAYSSTQHPSETQALIAEVLGIPRNEVEVEIRRMGGAFGGKETQGNHVAIWASLLAISTGCPVKIRLFRDDDQKMTGKRHRYLTKYKVGFDAEGIVSAIDLELNADAGAATDLTMAVLERAMMHAENSYFIPNFRIIGNAWFTNLPSNTAFRGFGGPQGMAGMEQIIDRIAHHLKKDAAEIRYKNLYGLNDRNITPYGQTIENNLLPVIWDQLIESSAYWKRKESIIQFNSENEFFKKGIAITPVKFGISFTTSHLNQAGALVHVYQDGTVLANHGGTEMGQGLHTKIRQIVAHEFGINVEKVKVNATNTTKVPNTSATAASAGTDLNGMAVKNAIEKIKKRIAEVIAKELNCSPETIVFENNTVFNSENSEKKIKFEKAVQTAYLQRTSLSATGFYRTPNVHFDREKGKGNPYFYFAFGMSVTEVLVDTLTGYVKTLRADILHDVGDSINTRLDIAQIEGGYIQGVGWVTTEELKWDDKGNLLNHSPDTYKIPNVQDVPEDFRVNLLEGYPNSVPSIRRSKAVAEPPLMHCFSCWLAIKSAISAMGNHEFEPQFELPATNEVVVLACEDIRKKMKDKVATVS